MNLVWKLLRQHISIPQFIGFFFANLFGMFIVLLGFQFYQDVMPVFTAEDSFMRADYLIMNKKIGTASTISGRSNTFNNSEIDDVSSQKFVKKVGKFTSAEYKITANMGVNGTNVLNSEIPVEAVPDEFIDDESEIEKKTKEAIKIQQYFREHRDKKKLYCGFEEPNYLVRIYEHEYEVSRYDRF